MNEAVEVDTDDYFAPGHACHCRNYGSCSGKENDGQDARIVSTSSSFSGCCTNDAYRYSVLIVSRRVGERGEVEMGRLQVVVVQKGATYSN